MNWEVGGLGARGDSLASDLCGLRAQGGQEAQGRGDKPLAPQEKQKGHGVRACLEFA